MSAIKVQKKDSNLLLDDGGTLNVKIFQCLEGKNIYGRVDGFVESQSANILPSSSTEEFIGRINKAANNGLNVYSFHPDTIHCKAEIAEASNNKAIVALAGRHKNRNQILLGQCGRTDTINKITMSSEDQKQSIIAGNELTFFQCPPSNTKAVSWAVLNCHDYTNAEILKVLLEEKAELIVVLAHNPATKLYWEYATADVHRLCCYVVIVNVAELGGSAVFAPIRRIGEEAQVQHRPAGKLFGTEGPSELTTEIPLDIAGLRNLRDEFSTVGLKMFEKGYDSEDPNKIPIVPSEHFLSTIDRENGAPIISGVNTIHLDWWAPKIRVAIAQLASVSSNAYFETDYRIRYHQETELLRSRLRVALVDLRLRNQQLKKDEDSNGLGFLVFPEVFMPRDFAKNELQEFSDNEQCIIIVGVDYPDGGESKNANECMIITPNASPFTYQKITRSQYDARRKDKSFMKMNRGSQLLRFKDPNGRMFGILICYDLSHIDLTWKLNLQDSSEPLDAIFVVSHNPFSQLYSSCCVADAHRFYQYVIMCNTSEYGGSGIYGPLRGLPKRLTVLEGGSGSDCISIGELNLKGLRHARETSDANLETGKFMRKPGLFQRS